MGSLEFLRESNFIEGIYRNPTEEEAGAFAEFMLLGKVAIKELGKLQAVFAPGKPLRDMSDMNVRVGNYRAPAGGPLIRNRLRVVLGRANGGAVTPWRVHMDFERLHPFMDGNGRTGRMLWAWQMFLGASVGGDLAMIRNRNPNIPTGSLFGRWTTIGPLLRTRPRTILCRCACGTERTIALYSLKNGNSRSCGCFKLEVAVDRETTHGQSRRTPEYRAWLQMKSRCFNPKIDSYKNYGGRGITVCKKWRDSFETFFADVGNRPTSVHSLDRIDNNGNYEPGNVRWATRTEQNSNQRSRRKRAV